MLDRRWPLYLLLWCGCGTTPHHGDEPPIPAERHSPPASDPDETPRVEPSPPRPASYAPDPEGFGDPCSDDAGCGWDDPCAPKRCVGAAHSSTLVCEETMPAPGECLCVAGRCSLRPNEADSEAPSCRTQACGLDQGAGRCVGGSLLGANRQTRDVGPACPCDEQSLECRFVWVESIACESVEACWVSDGRPHYPISRPKAKRGRKFRPCQDGEVAPACVDGRCSLVAYRC